MRRSQPLQGLAGHARFRRVRCDFHDLLPGGGRAVQILFTERADDPGVQKRLRMLWIEGERTVELRQCPVCLVHVVVGNPQVGACVDVLWIHLQRVLIPPGGISEPLRIEVQVRELDAHGGIPGSLLGCRLQ